MIYYSDTSFLCSLYRKQEHSPAAIEISLQMDEPLYFTSLLEFEFFQAMELQVWLHSQGLRKGYSREEAWQMNAAWEADVARGANQLISCEMDVVLRLARTFSDQLTAAAGHRTLDILHVATAVHLRAEKFLTFDQRQRTLAIYAGLEVPAA